MYQSLGFKVLKYKDDHYCFRFLLLIYEFLQNEEGSPDSSGDTVHAIRAVRSGV